MYVKITTHQLSPEFVISAFCSDGFFDSDLNSLGVWTRHDTFHLTEQMESDFWLLYNFIRLL